VKNRISLGILGGDEIMTNLHQAAIEFAVGFYDALGAGKPVEFAYKFGCAAIGLAGLTEQLTPILKKKQNIEEKYRLNNLG